MIYCEVLLSTSTRGRELKIFQTIPLQSASPSTSTRGRELKIKTCHRLSGINTVDLHERS